LATSIQEKQELVHQSESAFIRAWRRLLGFDCNCVYSLRDGVKWTWERTEPGQRPGPNHTAYMAGTTQRSPASNVKIKIRIENKIFYKWQ
jgi:hypothetical protein